MAEGLKLRLVTYREYEGEELCEQGERPLILRLHNPVDSTLMGTMRKSRVLQEIVLTREEFDDWRLKDKEQLYEELRRKLGAQELKEGEEFYVDDEITEAMKRERFDLVGVRLFSEARARQGERWFFGLHDNDPSVIRIIQYFHDIRQVLTQGAVACILWHSTEHLHETNFTGNSFYCFARLFSQLGYLKMFGSPGECTPPELRALLPGQIAMIKNTKVFEGGEESYLTRSAEIVERVGEAGGSVVVGSFREMEKEDDLVIALLKHFPGYLTTSQEERIKTSRGSFFNHPYMQALRENRERFRLGMHEY